MNLKKLNVVFLLVLISFPILIFPIISVKAPRSDWLIGFTYRKKHTITSASGAGTNYPIKFFVHYGEGSDSGENVYLNSLSQTDFSDVRFTEDDGTTTLDFWIEQKYDGDNATFWVEIKKSLSSSNQDIYIYYGNLNQSGSTFKIGIFTDTHYDNTDWNDGDIRQNRTQALEFLRDFCYEMNTTFDPDVVLGLGDFIQPNTEAEALTNLQAIVNECDNLTMPYYLTMGNHDFEKLSETQVKDITGYSSLYYSVEIGKYLFVCLDANYHADGSHFDHTYDSSVANIPQTQRDWLQETLDSTNKKVIVFSHYGIALPNGDELYWGSNGMANADTVRSILEASGKVIAVFQSHIHCNRYFKVNDIAYFNLESLVGNENKEQEYSDGFKTWGEVTINSWDKTVTFEVIDGDAPTWRTIATMELTYVFNNAYKNVDNPHSVVPMVSMDVKGDGNFTNRPVYSGGEVANWDEESDHANAELWHTQFKNVSKYMGLRYTPKTGGAYRGVWYHASGTQTSTYRVFFYVQKQHTDNMFYIFGNDGNDYLGQPNCGWYLSFYDDGNIKAINDTAWVTIQSYEAYQWYGIQLDVNVATGSFDISINGVLKEQDILFWNQTVGQLTHVGIMTKNDPDLAKTTWFDQFRIQKYVEPEPQHGSWELEESHIESWLPLMFILGIFGIVSMIGGAMYGVKELKKHNYEHGLVTAIIFIAVGFCFILAWLWG